MRKKSKKIEISGKLKIVLIFALSRLIKELSQKKTLKSLISRYNRLLVRLILFYFLCRLSLSWCTKFHVQLTSVSGFSDLRSGPKNDRNIDI